jgi:hypothetical protein
MMRSSSSSKNDGAGADAIVEGFLLGGVRERIAHAGAAVEGAKGSFLAATTRRLLERPKVKAASGDYG